MVYSFVVKDDLDGQQPDARGFIDVVGHPVLSADELAQLTEFPNNIIVSAKSELGAWVEDLTRMIGPARARFRSTYFQWALAINGLHLAAKKYESEEFQISKKFTIGGLRHSHEGHYTRVSLAEWRGPRAAAAHLLTVHKMCARGLIEMYAELETFVFQMYRKYLSHHRHLLLKGEEFAELRKIRRESSAPLAK